MMQTLKKLKQNFASDNNKSGVGKLISACTAWTDFLCKSVTQSRYKTLYLKVAGMCAMNCFSTSTYKLQIMLIFFAYIYHLIA